MAVRKLVGQTLIYGMGSIVGRLLNFGLTFLYVAYFPPAEFGVFSDLYALVSYPLVILTFGMETAFFRFSSQGQDAERAYSNSFWSVAYLTLVAAALGLLFLESLASLSGYPGRDRLMLYLIGITLFDVLAALPLARLRYRERPMRFAAISLSNVGFTIALNLLFVVVLGWGIESIFLANLIASGLRFLLAIMGGWPEQATWDWPSARPMLAFGGLIMLAGFSGQLNEMLDKNLLPRLWPDGKFFAGAQRSGIEMNGIYNASYKLGMIIALTTQAFRYAAEPFFFKQSADKQSPQLFARVFHYFMLAYLGVFMLVSVFRQEFASFTFFGLRSAPLIPQSYWPGMAIVPIVLLSNIALGAYINVSIWFKLTGKAHFGLWFSLVGTVVTVALNVLFIASYGYFASAWAHLACYGLMFLLCYGFGQRYYPLPYRMRRMLLYAVLVVGGFYLIEIFATNLANSGTSGSLPSLLRLTGVLLVMGSVWSVERFFPLFRATAS